MDTEVWGLELVWWLVIGIVVLALVLLLLASLPVLLRLPSLRHGGERLRRHAAAMEAVQARTAELQRRTEELAAKTDEMQQRISRLNPDQS